MVIIKPEGRGKVYRFCATLSAHNGQKSWLFAKSNLRRKIVGKLSRPLPSPAASHFARHPPPFLPLLRRENGFQALVRLLANGADLRLRLLEYFDHPGARIRHDPFYLRLLLRREIEAIDHLLVPSCAARKR